jgi:hypothetical protein
MAVPFLTSVLYGGKCLASRFGRFIPKENAPRTHGIGGWVDPRNGLEAVKKRKISCPYRELNLNPTAAQPVYRRYNDWAIPYKNFRELTSIVSTRQVRAL